MHPLTLLFILALAASLAVELWLLGRQVRAVRAHRDRVPPPFAASITPADHARAADYTVAQAGVAIFERIAAAGYALAMTLGGGIAALDAAMDHAALATLWQQVATIAAFGLLAALVGLPFEAWRTVRVQGPLGVNRTTPALLAAGALKALVVVALLLLPLAALPHRPR